MPRTFHSDAYVAFVEQLVAARKSAGLTQADLAKRLGRHQSFVSNFESRIRRLDIVETLVIARIIGLDPASIVMNLSARVDTDMQV